MKNSDTHYFWFGDQVKLTVFKSLLSWLDETVRSRTYISCGCGIHFVTCFIIFEFEFPNKKHRPYSIPNILKNQITRDFHKYISTIHASNLLITSRLAGKYYTRFRYGMMCPTLQFPSCSHGKQYFLCSFTSNLIGQYIINIHNMFYLLDNCSW